MKLKAMKKGLLWVAALLGAAVFLTACGNSAASSDGAAAPEDAQTETQEAAVDYTGLTDQEFLTTVGTWCNEKAPGVIYFFYEDGTGQLTTDNEHTIYEMDWSVEEGLLTFQMKDWPYSNDLQNYIFLPDKENGLFITVNPDTQSEAAFLPRDLVEFPTYEENKPEELLGYWVSVTDAQEVFSLRVWYLTAGEERSGYGSYVPEADAVFMDSHFEDWNVVEDSMAFVMENGTVTTLPYILEGGILTVNNSDGSTLVFEPLDTSGMEVNW